MISDAICNDDITWLKHNNELWHQVVQKWNNSKEQNIHTMHEFPEFWSIL